MYYRNKASDCKAYVERVELVYVTVAGKRERRDHCEPFIHWTTFKLGISLIRQKAGNFWRSLRLLSC